MFLSYTRASTVALTDSPEARPGHLLRERAAMVTAERVPARERPKRVALESRPNGFDSLRNSARDEGERDRSPVHLYT